MMTNTATQREEWPAWTKALLIAITLLAIVAVVPWILMTAMCMPMMGNMQQMMEPMR